MPNGDLGTVSQSLEIKLKGADEAKREIQEVSDFYTGLVDLMDDDVEINATEQFNSLRSVIQQTTDGMLELSHEFQSISNTSFGDFGSFGDFDTFTVEREVIHPAPITQPSFADDEGLILFDDEIENLSTSIQELNNSVKNSDTHNDFSMQENPFQSDFSSQFHDPFESVEDGLLDLSEVLDDVQNHMNSTFTDNAYVPSNTSTDNTHQPLVDTFSSDNLSQMRETLYDIDGSSFSRNMQQEAKIRSQYEGKLDYIPDDAGFSSLNSYYKELEKRYQKLNTMLSNLSDVDTDLATGMTDTRDLLGTRMNEVKATQQQQKADTLEERELLRQQAEDRKNQQRLLQAQQMQSLQQQRQQERADAQILLQEERRLNEEERRQKQEEREMVRLQGQAIAEDRQRTLALSQSTSNNIRSMQSNLNTTVINLNQAVQLMGTVLNKTNQLTNFYDEYTNSNARLNFSNLGDLSNTEYQKLVSQSASDARMSYADTANNIARFSMTGGFSSNKEIIEFAETIAKSMRVSGSDTNETSSSIRQLTQAISKGKLDGDEFRSIAENSPLLMNSLAKVLETDKAGVMKASSSGQLDLDTLKDAVKHMGEEVNEAFKDMPKTFRDLRTEMTNGLGAWLTTTKNGQDFMNELFDIYQEFVDFIGSDDGREAFKETAQFFRNMAQTVGGFIKVATPVLGVIGEHATLLGSMYLAYQAVNVGMKVHMLATTSELITNFTSMGTAMSALSTLALGFLANPVVLATLGIGAVAYSAVKLYDYVDEANTSQVASELGGLNREDLLAKGYQSDEALMLEELYANRNHAYNDLLYYETGSKYALADSRGAKSKTITNDEEYLSRKEEYESLLDQINQSSYLDRIVDATSSIAESSSKTAENTSESNFVKELQTELRQSQQVKTITQVTPNIVINIDGKNEDADTLAEKISNLLHEQYQVYATS